MTSRSRVLGALLLFAASAAPPSRAAAADWGAAIAVRPTARFLDAKSCRFLWSADELAADVDVVFLSAEGAIDSGARPPWRAPCIDHWASGIENDDASLANLGRLIAATDARRPKGRPRIEWILSLRFDLVLDTDAAQPGFDASFLADTRTPWSETLSFVEGAGPETCGAQGCRVVEHAGSYGDADCPKNACLRARIDASAGAAGAYQRKVYYLRTNHHPKYFLASALADARNAAYRRWRVGLAREAIARTKAQYVLLGDKFSQWNPAIEPDGGRHFARSAAYPDLASVRAKGATDFFSAQPDGLGWAEYVEGWTAIARDLDAAGVPFAVQVPETLFGLDGGDGLGTNRLWTTDGGGPNDRLREAARRADLILLDAVQGTRERAEEKARALRAAPWKRHVVVVDSRIPLGKGPRGQ